MKCFTFILTGFLMLAVGCQQPEMKESKKVAYDKWAASRANVLHSLARDHLMNGNIDKACAKAEEGLGLDPNSKDLQFLLARVYIEKGYYARSIGLLQSLADQEQSSDPARRSSILAEVHYLLGVAQEKEGKLDEAMASYNLSAQIDPSTSAPILAATEVLITKGQVAQAQDFLSCHMARYSPEPAMAELAGRLAMMQKQYQPASRHFQLACDLDSQNHRYPELLASAQYAGGEYRQAGETLSRLLRRKDYKAPTWIYTLQGDCMMANRRYEPAEKAYQHACLLRAEDPVCWTRLAKAALAQNRLTKAIRSAYKARDLDADNLDASVILGYSLMRIGKPELAVEVLLDICKGHPDEEVVLCLLGRAYSQLGQPELSRKYYEAARRVQPDSRLLEGLLAIAK